ncbi:MAG: radical SAM protein [Gammaproteobacteria bacterium]|nr:radical SAM protein [Gammaproteobacteria bacterium]
MVLDYEQPLYRPPSEANNLILQVTIGCRFNQCSFCSMYKHKKYRLKSLGEIQHDIDIAKKFAANSTRVFLADGDAFNLDTDQLLAILKLLQVAFPRLTRVSCYATPANIAAKSAADLNLLKAHKLSLLYVGIESGSNLLLKKITKGATQNSIIKSLKMADSANIKVSATVILGLGGQQHWRQHINETARLLNQAPVTYLSTLQLFLDATSRSEFFEKYSDDFTEQSDKNILTELSELIRQLEPVKRVVFRSNHASNILALAGNLPKDKSRLLSEIEQALNSAQRFTAHSLRSL